MLPTMLSTLVFFKSHVNMNFLSCFLFVCFLTESQICNSQYAQFLDFTEYSLVIIYLTDCISCI